MIDVNVARLEVFYDVPDAMRPDLVVGGRPARRLRLLL
jgi:hypothetical protein